MNNHKTYLATWQRRFGNSDRATIDIYAFGIREHINVSRLDRATHDAYCTRLANVRNTIANYGDVMNAQRLADLSNEEFRLKTHLLME